MKIRDIKNGMVYKYDNNKYQIVKINHAKSQAHVKSLKSDRVWTDVKLNSIINDVLNGTSKILKGYNTKLYKIMENV